MTGWLEIADAEDPRVQVYRALREPDATVRRHGFIVEGPLALERALSYGLYPLASALVSTAKAERIAAMIASAGSALPLYVAPQTVMDELCGFSVHRGVLAYGRSPELPTVQALVGRVTSRLLVCAIGINDVENMGALFRNAAAFGAAAVLLDPTSCDPLHRRAIRVSAGAALSVATSRFAKTDDFVAMLQAGGWEPIALTPAGATSLKAVTPNRRTALLVGAEGPGLPAPVLTRCRTVRIPMAAGFDSLNVAAATAVALHHLQSTGWTSPAAA